MRRQGPPAVQLRGAEASSLAKHIMEGKHREGLIRPYTSGVAVGRSTANDRDVRAASQALLGVSSGGSGGEASSGASATQPAEGFNLQYVDGQQYPQPPVTAGWACSQRLPSVRSTLEQIEFVYHAFHIKSYYPQMQFSPAQAREVMQQVGTPAFAAQYSIHPYFGINLGKARFRRNDVLEEPKLKTYFGKGTALKGMLERAQKKGQVVEDSGAPAAATATPTRTG